MTEIHWMSGLELEKTYREKKLSPVEVVRALLERIEALNPSINAFVTLIPEEALATAREAERQYAAGGVSSPLLGVPVAVKDNLSGDLFVSAKIKVSGQKKRSARSCAPWKSSSPWIMT